jgi:hypothetical protein
VHLKRIYADYYEVLDMFIFGCGLFYQGRCPIEKEKNKLIEIAYIAFKKNGHTCSNLVTEYVVAMCIQRQYARLVFE